MPSPPTTASLNDDAMFQSFAVKAVL
jgi:hypothetical protein